MTEQAFVAETAIQAKNDINEYSIYNFQFRLGRVRRNSMNYRLHHLHVICKDLEGMIDFFCGALGATLLARKKFGTADGASLDLQGTTVNLRVAREDEDIAGDASRTTFGYDHLGLQVDDVDAAYQDLKKRGFPFFMEPKDIPNLRIAFFKGFEDITIELVQETG